MTTTSTMSTDADPSPVSGDPGQTFLVGPDIFLRAIEKADAGVGMSWRDTVFPLSPATVERWISEEMVKDRDTQWLAIVRHSDDRVVGSVRTFTRYGPAILDLFIDPLFGDRGDRWKREALGLVVPWIVDERHIRKLRLSIDADDDALVVAASELGMRQVARFREQVDREGLRIDRLVFERHNAHWLATLGDPLAEELPRSGTGLPRPVPAPVPLEGEPPPGAVMLGRRVYLRAAKRGDLDELALWSRRETETGFLLGRRMESAVGMVDGWSDADKGSLPTSVMFSVCLRDDDAFIGGVDLFGIDYQNRFAETGSYFHRPDDRGKGYGSEAKHLLLEYAFDRLGLHSLQSRVYFTNTRSAAALRKQGYRDAGRSTWEEPAHGGMINAAFFDLLASEWRALPRAR
ncbi:MAG: GNAT family N-acetyltransferase [Chloroflexota bacterium]|nr:GNAT family N-acetyltransferase [Chloroflexota bacterium]